MTHPQPDFNGPCIEIHLTPGGVDIHQQRPAITRALVGLPATVALQRIPSLLPICGNAQAIAAARAVAAAKGNAQHPQPDLDASLRQEQALACGWRLCVDWPDLLGETRQMTALKQLYQAQDDKQRATALGQMITGMDTVRSLEALLAWVEDSDCLAARVIRHTAEATGANARIQEALPLLDESGLRSRACAALAAEPFDPLDPAGGPLEMGPLAMGRDPLVMALQDSMGSTVLSRLLAQLLDTRFIARALLATPSEQQPAGAPASARSLPRTGDTNSGMGWAVTARGPVFHQVQLADGADTAADTVVDWRVLAPTDWHFGRHGPVKRELSLLEASTRGQVALVVASYDPCAPWTLHRAATAEHHA
jgi:hypothetical protein